MLLSEEEQSKVDKLQSQIDDIQNKIIKRDTGYYDFTIKRHVSGDILFSHPHQQTLDGIRHLDEFNTYSFDIAILTACIGVCESCNIASKDARIVLGYIYQDESDDRYSTNLLYNTHYKPTKELSFNSAVENLWAERHRYLSYSVFSKYAFTANCCDNNGQPRNMNDSKRDLYKEWVIAYSEFLCDDASKDEEHKMHVSKERYGDVVDNIKFPTDAIKIKLI